MSYQVLARKWRPGNFSQVAGQAHVLQSLINALDNQRLHHAYLFTGTRGVGKTTLARILAKCLNCEEGVTSTPCESCGSCQEINEGRFIDLIEVDAASKTKVEDTRELLENVQYSPTRGRYKVYLIDEVHMLSNHSFNALLKTLEEPPPHVKFLFATTDPQKLPITILSRCLQFNLKNLNPQLIVEYLQTVLSAEKIENEEEALWQIASAASGSMRDALTLVDQAISYCQGKVSAKGVVEMLGIPPQQQVYELLSGMASKDIPRVLSLINEVSEQVPDYIHTLDNLLSALHRIAIAQLEPGAVDNSFGDRDKIVELAGKLTAEDVQLFYQMGLKGREDLRLSGEVRIAFEMLLIRMLVFSPDYVAQQEIVSAEPAESEKKKNSELETEAVEIVDDEQAEATTEVEATREGGKAESQTEILSQSSASANDEFEPGQPLADESQSPPYHDREADQLLQQEAETSFVEPTVSQVLAVETDSAPITPPESVGAASLSSDNWLAIFPQLTITGIASSILANSIFKSREANKLHFTLDKNQSAVYSDDIIPKIARAFVDFYGEELAVEIEIADVEDETPAKLAQRLREEQHAGMVKDFEEDENVKELLQKFSATLLNDSIAEVSERGGNDRL